MIRVLGMDPSMRNWGLAWGEYNPHNNTVTQVTLDLIKPKETNSKQVRQNCKDLEIARWLAEGLYGPVRSAPVIFAEVPVGSQSSRAQTSYGICVGILGTLQQQGFQIIEVTASEVKRALTGKTTATKGEMIAAAKAMHPMTNWTGAASNDEHTADAIGAIYAGIQLPAFQNLLRLYTSTARPTS